MDGFGDRLRERAAALGMTSREVSRRLGISEQRYSRYVLDQREPDYRALLRICAVLDTTPDFLLGVGPAPGGDAEDRVRAQVAASLAQADGPRLRAALRILSALSLLDLERTERGAPEGDPQVGVGRRNHGGG